jgi:hypothetical protein
MILGEAIMSSTNKVYERTENGASSIVSREEGLSEINEAMIGRAVRERSTRTMSSLNRTDYSIVYRDGRAVTLRLVDEPAKVETDSEGRRTVTVKGKRYVVSAVTPARPRTEGAATWVPEAYVRYWTGGPLGVPSGPTRTAKASMRPGTVGRAIWDAVDRA